MVDGDLDSLLAMDGETRGDTDLLDSTWFDTILPPEAVECPLPPEPEEEPDTLGALLAYACDVGSLENVQSLLRQGAIPSRSFHNGKSAIEWATLKQHKEILACLKEHIPNIDTQQNEQPKMKRTKLKPPPPNMQPHNTIDLVDDEPMEETRRRKIPPRQAPPTTLLSTTSRTSSTSSSSTRQPQTKRRDVLSLYHYERRPVDPRSKSKPRHDDATTTSKLSDGSRSKSNPRKSNKPLESDDLGVISVPPVDNNPFVDIQDKSNPQLHTEKKSRDIPRGHEESFRHEKSVARRTRERSRSSSRSPPRNHPWHPSMDMIILFVGNLSKSATENEVRDLFSKCGVIQYFNRGINHAHITFAKVEEAIDALGLNDHVFHGKPLRISVGERSNRKLAREVKQRLRERVDSMPEPLPKRKRSRSRSPEKWKHDKYEERESKRRLDRSSSPTRSKSHHRESRSSKSHYRDSDSRSSSRYRDSESRSSRSHRRDHSSSRYRSREGDKSSSPSRSKRSSRYDYYDRDRSEYRRRDKYEDRKRDRSKSRSRRSEDEPSRSRSVLRSSSRHHSRSSRHDVVDLCTPSPSRSKRLARVEYETTTRTSDKSQDATLEVEKHRSRSQFHTREEVVKERHQPTARTSHYKAHTLEEPSIAMAQRRLSVARATPVADPKQRSRSVAPLDRSRLSTSFKGRSQSIARSTHYGPSSSSASNKEVRQRSTSTMRGSAQYEDPHRRSRSRSIAPVETAKSSNVFGGVRSQSIARASLFVSATTFGSHTNRLSKSLFRESTQDGPHQSSRSAASTGGNKHTSSSATLYKVFVSNVSKRATNEALCRMFGICGKVAGFKRNVVNGVPQSLVQVTFETKKAVDKALALEGLELCGKAIHVELWEA